MTNGLNKVLMFVASKSFGSLCLLADHNRGLSMESQFLLTFLASLNIVLDTSRYSESTNEL